MNIRSTHISSPTIKVGGNNQKVEQGPVNETLSSPDQFTKNRQVQSTETESWKKALTYVGKSAGKRALEGSSLALARSGLLVMGQALGGQTGAAIAGGVASVAIAAYGAASGIESYGERASNIMGGEMTGKFFAGTVGASKALLMSGALYGLDNATQAFASGALIGGLIGVAEAPSQTL